MKNLIIYDSTIGRISIADNGRAITDVFFGRIHSLQTRFKDKETTLNLQALEEIQEFLAGTRKSFSVPLALKGTPFQVSVWEALQNIPYGETRSYRDIAEEIGNPNSYRAVGLANNKNPVSIIIPCHRVIGANGDMIGYGGGLNKKKRLLDIEAKYKDK